MSELERVFNIYGAFDGTSHPRNYGINAMRLFFAVRGPHGGVSATFSTSWYLPQNQQQSFDLFAKGYPFNVCEELMQPKWWDISVHSKVQQYEHQFHTKECSLTDGDCYGDGSSL